MCENTIEKEQLDTIVGNCVNNDKTEKQSDQQCNRPNIVVLGKNGLPIIIGTGL